MKSLLMVAFMLLSTILFPGCATLFSGTTAKVKVADGNPPKAKVYMNGNYLGETPLNFKIPKKSFGKDSEIEIKADGYKPLTVTIEKTVNGGYIVLDVLFTGCLGLLIDFGTGAAYDPSPSTVKYNLEKL